MKLLSIATQIDSIPMPTTMVTSLEAQALLLDIRTKASLLSEFIRTKAGSL